MNHYQLYIARYRGTTASQTFPPPKHHQRPGRPHPQRPLQPSLRMRAPVADGWPRSPFERSDWMRVVSSVADWSFQKCGKLRTASLITWPTFDNNLGRCKRRSSLLWGDLIRQWRFYLRCYDKGGAYNALISTQYVQSNAFFQNPRGFSLVSWKFTVMTNCFVDEFVCFWKTLLKTWQQKLLTFQVLHLCTSPLTNSYIRVPRLLWQYGWDPLVDNEQQGEFPDVPAEYLEEKEVLTDFISIVTHIGRQCLIVAFECMRQGMKKQPLFSLSF